jgi:hypothetical protein
MYVLALIGAVTITTLAYREVHFQWKSRNWKPTIWLCLPR